MILSVGLCILPLVGAALMNTNIGENPNDSGSEVTAYYSRNRVQRGVSAIVALLKRATRVEVKQNYGFYRRSGGSKQADKDFESLRPKTIFVGPYIKRGLVGDYEVEVRRESYREGIAELTIQHIRRNPDGTVSHIRHLIAYGN